MNNESACLGTVTARVVEQERARLRVLSISCVFPNPRDVNYGCFVRNRLVAMAAFADVKVIAPVPLFDWSQRRGLRAGDVPASASHGGIEVLYPRWLYPPLSGALNSLLLFFQLLPIMRRLRRQHGFELLDSHFAYPDGIAAAMLAVVFGVPFTITLRGNEPMHARYPLRGWMIRWAVRRAARIIAVSTSLYHFAVSLGADPKRVCKVPNGVQSDIFYPRDRVQCRRKWGISDDACVILSAGALIERKGHHRTATALSHLIDRGLDATLLIVGGPGREGNFEEQLRERVASLGLNGAVRMLGSVSSEEMAELMSAADVLSLASSREGWPNVVHEALACGTPVVATSVGSAADLLPCDRYGFVVSVDDQQGLNQALERALQREWDRAEIARWGGARSWDQVAREVVRTFEEILCA